MRFFDVEDERWLAMKLDNIFLKSQKIFVNVPRFHRGNMEGVQDKPETRNVTKKRAKHTRNSLHYQHLNDKVRQEFEFASLSASK